MDYCEKHDMVPGSADDGRCVDCENESLRQQLAAKDAELKERNNVMHRAVEDADSLRKEVERLHREKWEARDRLEKAEKERDEAKVMADFEEDRSIRAEERVRELEEKIHQLNIGKGTSITGQEADNLRERIKAMTAAGDKREEMLLEAYNFFDSDQYCREDHNMQNLKERIENDTSWDKAKGEAVPYNDGAR